MHPERSKTIPAVGGTIVRYWLSVADLSGGAKTDPGSAPARETHLYLAGAVDQVLFDDMESDPGWTVGAPGDAATTGLWIRAEPVGTAVNGVQVQPEFDHTPDPGSLCFVTGNAAPSDPVGTADVDGGATTLLPPVFFAVGFINPVIEYYRWYSNNGGADPGTDFWRVDVSNDGGVNWTPVENTNLTDANWRRVAFMIGDLLPPTTSMRLRFIASDVRTSSLVEAAVDDFRLLALPATTGVESRSRPRPLGFRLPQPNPFSRLTTLRFSLSEPARVSLEIHDVSGRVIRVLDQGAREPGEHTVRWDGRDDLGREVPAGTYYARLTANGILATRSIVRIH